MAEHKIIIPNPCNEGWDNMQPSDGGRYCKSCEKTVVDFTRMDRDEIKQFFIAKKGEKICGHFKTSQVHAPAATLPVERQKPWLHRKLISWYEMIEQEVSVRFLRAAFLGCVSLCMILVGCKNDPVGSTEEMEMLETVDGGIGPEAETDGTCDPVLTGDTTYVQPQDSSFVTVSGEVEE